MPEPDESLSGLPDIVRNSNRPIVIYQGVPPGVLDAPTSNALALLIWLALLTVCLGAVLFCLWRVWNPGYDAREFSPIYAEGRPRGLAKQVEEREEINARAEGLVGFPDQLRALRASRSSAFVTHPLITDRDGVDDVRQQWDAMCNNIRARLYDRRLGQIDARMFEARRQRALARDPAERARLDDDLLALQRERRAQIEIRRTDSDPALRCIPAAEAAVCSDSDASPWCNPDFERPREFSDEAS